MNLVRGLSGIDPDPDILARAQARVAEATAPVRLLAAAGESLPFAAAAFDVVVVTLALCSVASQDHVLREMHRVLKPGGKLHFMEHIRSETTGWARFQDVVTPAWKKVASG